MVCLVCSLQNNTTITGSFFRKITQIYTEIVYYLMSPSEEARSVDVWMRFILIVRHLNVVPHAVVYPGHDA